MASDFHEVRFPLDVSLGSRGGPVRRTDIVSLASGREHRNSRWASSRRRYDAGLGVRTVDALHAVIAFFEERRGKLYGFRFRDRTDWRSGAPSKEPTPLDQRIGTGDGTTKSFQLVKTYGSSFAPYVRTIAKPVSGSVPRAAEFIGWNELSIASDQSMIQSHRRIPAVHSALRATRPAGGRRRWHQADRELVRIFRLRSVLQRHNPGMRLVWIIMGLWGMLGAAHAQSATAALQNCLPPREMQEAVASKGVVAPASAVMTARRQVPNADVVRANLCRSSDTLVYVIMALQKDGRIVQVMIDGPTGRVKSVH